MVQVNGFQNPGLNFPRPAGGLGGFVRQGMDQRKKAATDVTTLGPLLTGSAIAGAAVQFPTGTKVGDWAILTATNNGVQPTLSTAGWTVYGGGVMGLYYFCKQLVAADLGVTWTSITSITVAWVLRSALMTGINQRYFASEQFSTGTGTDTDFMTATGFTKSPTCRGLLLSAGQSTGSALHPTFTAPAAVIPPAGSTVISPDYNGGGGYMVKHALELVVGEYMDGTPWTASGYQNGVSGTSYNQRCFIILELV